MQVLLGIQSNALKFTETGQIEINVEIIEDLDKDVQHLKISVIDSGVGIAED